MYQLRDTGPALGRHQYELVFTEAQPSGRALDELASLSFVEQIDLVDDGQAPRRRSAGDAMQLFVVE